MAQSEKNGGDVHGIAESACRHCGETIPEDTLACPECGKERLFNQEQYDMLMRCSEAQDVSEWDAWHEANPTEDIYLEGADLSRAHLENAPLWHAHLEGAYLADAHLEGAHLWHAHLEAADLTVAHLEGARLLDAHLEGAYLANAHLEGADLVFAHLEGAIGPRAIVNTETTLWHCTCSKRTDFTGVGLDAARIEPGLKGVLQRNIRQIDWERWYDSQPLRRYVLGPLVRVFWSFTDYGSSTMRIILWFIGLCFAFALVYCKWPALLDDRYLLGLDGSLAGLVRAGYFSVVTMTTLGFGDIRANPASPIGHIVVALHVLLGYVLLGALITRFAIMFQGTSVPHVPERE